MWTSLIQIQRILQNLRPLRVVFESKSSFSGNHLAKKQLKMRVIDRNLFIIVIASIFGLRRVLKTNISSQQIDKAKAVTPEDIKTQTQKMVLGAVLFILFMTLYSICLATTWTFKYRSKNAIFMMNQARGLYLDRLMNPGKIPGAPTKRESALFGALLYTLMMTCFVPLIMVTVFPATSRDNPSHIICTWLLPANVIEERPILIKIFCCLYMGIFGYFGVIPVVQAFSFITAVLYEAKFLLKRGYKYGENVGIEKHSNSLHRQWIIYAQNIIFIREINRFGSCLYPMIMLTAFCINVVTTMVCMKFYQQLSTLMLVLFLGFDVVVAVATVIVHSFGVVAKEESERFRKYWKPRLFSKLARKQLNACIPTPINIGPFFELQRSTLLRTVSEVVNMVVTLLLADE